MSLAQQIGRCGPVADAAAAERLHEKVALAATRDGWDALLNQSWPALEPVFGASSYLASLARRSPDALRRSLAEAPDARLAQILADTAAAGALDAEAAAPRLRVLKGELHLLTALADLGGVWNLDQVTGALTDFADAALGAAQAVSVRAEIAAGRLIAPEDVGDWRIPGYFCIAMGKYGAHELNYSSDIDYSVFYDPDLIPVAEGVEPQSFAVRLTQAVSLLMQERTQDGYVFRVDLRLRPDPSATPIAVPVAAAIDYYQSLGQNWERAAFIKARPCAGDIGAAKAFLEELQPFIWRKNLDFAAIEDVHSIKRQIHVHKVDERLDPRGADLKLGRGGIREIEFYVQTQQLILGGRDEALRSFRTLDALAALQAAGHVAPAAAAELTESYRTLRALEHRVQMIADHQTHKLPESDAERKKVAFLAGDTTLRGFDARVKKLLVGVNARYGELFAEDEALSSRFGSLVFTGVEDDPATLETLSRMGFDEPARVSETIRAWHHGRIPATRSERGRELFTRLAPRLLEAAHDSGAPNAAFNRFSDFFAGLNSGVQVQSLFLAQPKLLELIVEVLAFAPNLAATLSRNPAALDALMDPGFFDRVEPEELNAAVFDYAGPAEGFEGKMDAVRRAHREQTFRIGIQMMAGIARATEAGADFTALADACMAALLPAALAETERLGGSFPGAVAVIGLGKCGSREMTATSDIDLVVVYRTDEKDAVSSEKGWWGETFYGRFTHRLVSALSAPTAEGGLYEIDLKLRPYGNDGPAAVSIAALKDYYETTAETWEMMALTRARIVWSTSQDFQDEVRDLIEQILRRPREPKTIAADVRDMRALMEREKAAFGLWDLKLARGGLVDIEFAAQFLQIVHAGDGGPLVAHTGDALAAMRQAGLADTAHLETLERAWRLQQNLSQITRLAISGRPDPAGEPSGFRALLARAGEARDFKALTALLEKSQKSARGAFEAIVRV